MHPKWQEHASRLKIERARFSKEAVPMLHRPTAAISGMAAAANLGLTILLADNSEGDSDLDPEEEVGSKAAVRLGVFTMPGVAPDIIDGPKALLLDEDHQWFHFQARADISREFLQAMHPDGTAHTGAGAGASHGFGILLSGPNGTGKSAVGVEAALSAFALGLVCVYIPTANVWVAAAKAGQGDSFFLEQLLRQNVDLIAAQPVLRAALAPALALGPEKVGQMEGPLAEDIMDALRAALTAKSAPSIRVGVVVDGVQAITEVIEAALTKPIPANRTAGSYFEQWHNWDSSNQNAVFVRMDIGSNHGNREFTLPAGDAHRLRIIKPWTADLIAAATTAVGSPCRFLKAHEAARQRIVSTAGGILRSLFRGQALLVDALAAYDKKSPAEKSAAGAKLSWAARVADTSLRTTMGISCDWWFRSLSADEKAEVSSAMLRLVRGKMPWTVAPFKGLYDIGLVAHCDDSLSVKPVSAAASSAITAELADHYLKAVQQPLLTVEAGAERSNALQLQVIARLARIGLVSLPAKTLACDMAAPKVPVHADALLSCDGVADLAALAHAPLPRLYVPTSDFFACDAITVPSAAAAGGHEPIVVWEMSDTDPRDAERMQKAQTWFSAAGIVTRLRAAYPKRPIVCALCWPGKIKAAAAHTAELAALTAAAAAACAAGVSVRVAVVDMEGLQALGVTI